jgi:uncharacterized protein YneF (UPF0154 family)
MKKEWTYISGILTGVVVTLVLMFAFFYIPELIRENTIDETPSINRDSIRLAYEEQSRRLEEQRYGLTTFDERSVKVTQVIQSVNNDKALVRGNDKFDLYLGTLYLLEYGSPNTLYDGQVIKIPKGKVLRMSGIYQYRTTDGGYKTVPKVKITDK